MRIYEGPHEFLQWIQWIGLAALQTHVLQAAPAAPLALSPCSGQLCPGLKSRRHAHCARNGAGCHSHCRCELQPLCWPRQSTWAITPISSSPWYR